MHLDSRGLVALWREGLLAKAVLAGKTRGYRSHPQLDRFRRCADPVGAIDAYLWHVQAEAVRRGYHFDARKLGPRTRARRLPLPAGQLDLEWTHLMAKLKKRDRTAWSRERLREPCCHPSFRVVPGGIAEWERARIEKR